MKTMADKHLSLLRLVFSWRGVDRLSLAVLCGFSLTEPGRLYPEAEMWSLAAPAVGRGQVLDLGMPKPEAEALVLGKCFAPGGKPVPAALAAFRVGPIEKTLQVMGDRHFKPGGLKSTPTEPQPFTEINLTWENAFGGPEYKANPSGKGLVLQKDQKGNQILPLPNVMALDQTIVSTADRPKPAGIAPQGLDWQIRLRNRGTYNQDWLMNRWPGLPDDFDFDFFNLSARDQRARDFFKGNETILAKNMHPEFPEIQSRLPGLRCRLFARQLENGRELFSRIETRLDTVYLIPHQDLGLLIWHGTIKTRDDEAGDVQDLLAFTEYLEEKPRPDEYYYQKLQTPAKEVREAEPVEPPKPPESQKIEPPALPGVQAASPVVMALIDQLDREIDETEETLKKYLKEHGVDPDGLIGQPTPDPEPLPQRPVEQVLDELDREIEANEKELTRYLSDQGLQPDQLTPPQPAARKSIDHAADLEKYYQAGGLTDPELLAQVKKLYQETKSEEAALEEALKALEMKAPELSAETDLPAPEIANGQGPPWSGRPLTREMVLQAYAEGVGFSGLDLSGLDLSGCDLSGINLNKAVLEKTDFSGTNLSRADLGQSLLTEADLSETNLAGARLAEASAARVKAARADFTGANLKHSDFSGADLTEALLPGADLSGAVFDKAQMSGLEAAQASAARASFAEADLNGSKWPQADLTKADLTLTNLQGADFSNINAPDLRMHGARAQGVNFRQAQLARSRAALQADFQKAIFTGADLSDACWEDSNLAGADFSQTNLAKAHIKRCRLHAVSLTAARARGANFSKSDLSEAKMTRIDLLGGSLRKARLTRADCRLANLYGVDFYKSIIGDTDFDRANLNHTLLKVFGKK